MASKPIGGELHENPNGRRRRCGCIRHRVCGPGPDARLEDAGEGLGVGFARRVWLCAGAPDAEQGLGARHPGASGYAPGHTTTGAGVNGKTDIDAGKSGLHSGADVDVNSK